MLQVEETAFGDVKLVIPQVHADERGYFKEVFSKRKYAQIGISSDFVQDNVSRSEKNVLRGMHYNPGVAKLVQALHGTIYDVVVDMRASSPFYKEWFGCRLSAQNHRQLYIPAGFAHGFLTLSNEALVLYKQSDFYDPEHDRILAWNDPSVGIEWPLDGAIPTLSARDAAAQ
ncbi:MAG: dTDP-4-dehydrorhamnose 3,5-epimerase [Candidatus Eremiobacteraeota bacterium]|nr:dTDP-4-dehydrorhamnose 3,5-epimerase [Candidatus Eremiobacteraeota bacterium]